MCLLGYVIIQRIESQAIQIVLQGKEHEHNRVIVIHITFVAIVKNMKRGNTKTMANKVFCCDCVHIGYFCASGQQCKHPDLQIEGAINYITRFQEPPKIILCKDFNSQGNCTYFNGKPTKVI